MSKSKTLKLNLIGLDKIALDQYIPAIRGNKNLELVAACSPNSRPKAFWFTLTS
jgi:predicted dehydrogenase